MNNGVWTYATGVIFFAPLPSHRVIRAPSLASARLRNAKKKEYGLFCRLRDIIQEVSPSAMVEKRLLIGESRFPNLRYRLRTGWGGGGGEDSFDG